MLVDKENPNKIKLMHSDIYKKCCPPSWRKCIQFYLPIDLNKLALLLNICYTKVAEIFFGLHKRPKFKYLESVPKFWRIPVPNRHNLRQLLPIPNLFQFYLFWSEVWIPFERDFFQILRSCCSEVTISKIILNKW